MRQSARKFFLKSFALHLFVLGVYQFGCPRASVRSEPLGVSVQVLSGEALPSLPSAHDLVSRAASKAARPAALAPSAQAGNTESKVNQALSVPVGNASGTEASMKERYLYELRLLLDSRKQYPPIARNLRQQGTVEVGFLLHADGSVEQMNIVRPSSHAHLNRAALQLVEAIGKFKPLPMELQKTLGWRVSVPIEYRLE